MKLYSTNNKAHTANFQQAILRGLAPNRGLYMPQTFPAFNRDHITEMMDLSFPDLAFHVVAPFIADEIPSDDLQQICTAAVNFPAPVHTLEKGLHALELFHGPTLAFKDFGARFMAQCMSYFIQGENQKLVVLVATSGDTGGAVAAGFHTVPGIEVVILFPKGRVSKLQQLQLTCLDDNISAIEIDGSFDDCQDMVKQAFNDKSLTEQLRLTSANSINIARLLPQMFYYFEAYKQLHRQSPNPEISFAVPSGNFGNLCAGLFSKKIGLPIKGFVAATNTNDIVPSYLEHGIFTPKASIATISNAMDVGNPSNFERMVELFHHNIDKIRAEILGCSYSDQETKNWMKQIYSSYQYIADPHSAIGYAACQEHKHFAQEHIFLCTAHPAKFLPVVEETLDLSVEIPKALSDLDIQNEQYISMNPTYEEFKTYLVDTF